MVVIVIVMLVIVIVVTVQVVVVVEPVLSYPSDKVKLKRRLKI